MEVDVENALKNIGELVSTVLPAAMQQFGVPVPQMPSGPQQQQQSPGEASTAAGSSGGPPPTADPNYLRQVSNAVAAILDPLGIGVQGYVDRLHGDQTPTTTSLSTSSNVGTTSNGTEPVASTSQASCTTGTSTYTNSNTQVRYRID